MFNLYQYENFLYTMDLTGKQIKDFLEFSYGKQFATMTGPDDHLIAFTRTRTASSSSTPATTATTRRPASYNYDSVAGIKYTVDVSKPAGSARHHPLHGRRHPLRLAKTYSVAINSYRGPAAADT